MISATYTSNALRNIHLQKDVPRWDAGGGGGRPRIRPPCPQRVVKGD